jgi:hypothetical protein
MAMIWQQGRCVVPRQRLLLCSLERGDGRYLADR